MFTHASVPLRMRFLLLGMFPPRDPWFVLSASLLVCGRQLKYEPCLGPQRTFCLPPLYLLLLLFLPERSLFPLSFSLRCTISASLRFVSSYLHLSQCCDRPFLNNEQIRAVWLYSSPLPFVPPFPIHHQNLVCLAHVPSPAPFLPHQCHLREK